MHKKETPTPLISPEKTPCDFQEQEKHLSDILSSPRPFQTLRRIIDTHIPERTPYETDVDLSQQIKSNPGNPQPRQTLLWCHLPTIFNTTQDYRHLGIDDHELLVQGLETAQAAINQWQPPPDQPQTQDRLSYQLNSQIRTRFETVITRYYGLSATLFPIVKLYLEIVRELETLYHRPTQPADLPTIKELVAERIENSPDPNQCQLFFSNQDPSEKDARKNIWRGDLLAQIHSIHTQSLPLSEETDSAPSNSETTISTKQLHQTMSTCLESLSPREKQVLSLRFGLNGNKLTAEAVAKQFGVTKERIRQIEAKALNKLRHPAKSKHLRDYLS